MKNNPLTILAFIILSSLIFLACARPKKITILGRFLDKCDGQPIAKRHFRVSGYRHYSLFSSYKNAANVGEGETNEKGILKFSFIKDFNGGEWTLKDEASGTEYFLNLYDANNGILVLGDFVQDTMFYRSKILLGLENNTNPTDTLFVQIGKQLYTYHPINSKQYQIDVAFSDLQYGYKALPIKTVTDILQWGIGYKNFNKTDSIHRIEIKANPCFMNPYEQLIFLKQ